MSNAVASRQFSFRLPQPLVDRVERCTDTLRAHGLEVTRADVVRLLLQHALDATRGRLELLVRPQPWAQSSSRIKRR
jgi:hypothetical protein